MSETWALLPVKKPETSKTRLLSVLQPQECAMLSRAMFMDVLTAVEATSGITHVAVLTNDDDVAALTTQLGHEVIRDNSATELCDGLTAAAAQLAKSGATSLLILPGDLPTITANDLEQLLDQHSDGLSLCPAIRDGGTNALICSPPDAIKFQYGTNSAQRHLDTAAAQSINSQRLTIAAFFRDIDVAEDLLWLSSQPADTHTVRFLRQSGIFARLTSGLTGATA
jgi:2-phospho-L-lactate guanylyltransferase